MQLILYSVFYLLTVTYLQHPKRIVISDSTIAQNDSQMSIVIYLQLRQYDPLTALFMIRSNVLIRHQSILTRI